MTSDAFDVPSLHRQRGPQRGEGGSILRHPRGLVLAPVGQRGALLHPAVGMEHRRSALRSVCARRRRHFETLFIYQS